MASGGTADRAESLQLRTPNGRVPLGFVEEGSTVYLIARERSAAWPVAVLREGRAELRLSDHLVDGRAELVTGSAERARILEKFRSKYGEERFARWYDRPARVLAVRSEGPRADLGPGSERYYDWLRAEFDNVAEDYDRHITGNRINRLLRDRSLARLQLLFRDVPQLFEVGCGSGMETIPLLRSGHEIVAVDISDRMLEVVRRKAREEGLSERLRTRQLRARDLERLVGEFGPGSFGGGYSTYGALNCEPDLSGFPGAVHALLGPHGRFLTAVYNRWCLFELAGYSASLQFRRAWGRRANPVPVGASRFCVDIYAHSLPEILRLFAPLFELEEVEGVPVILPPSDLTEYAERFSRRFETLARWDAWLGRQWPWRALGDHFLIALRKRSPAAGG